MKVTEETLRNARLLDIEEAALRQNCHLPLSVRQRQILGNLMSTDINYLVRWAGQKLARAG